MTTNRAYAHLSVEQIEQIRERAAEIRAAGDGWENTMPIEDARILVSYEQLKTLLDDHLIESLPFDIDTGMTTDRDMKVVSNK